VEQVVNEATVEGLVQVFSKNEGFMSHRKSNEFDLKLKYEYLYTLSHKILAEAKVISIKRKTDPDRTNLSYINEHKHKSAQ
jgi:hypothetical protein